MHHLPHISARALRAGAALACVACSASAWAASASTIVVRAEAECAGEDGRATLIKALKARLGAETSYAVSVDAQTPHWTLTWAATTQEACTLSLVDIEPVMTLPLSKDAGSQRMQEVLVRIVWMVSTQPARTPALPPVAALPPPTAPPQPVTPDPVVPTPAAPEPILDELKPPDPAPQDEGDAKVAQTTPASVVKEDDAPGDAPVFQDADLSSFERFQASLPGLFGYEHLNATSAFEFNWSDKPTLFSPHVGWTYRAGVTQGEPVFSSLLQVGVIIDRAFNIGLSYQVIDRQQIGSQGFLSSGRASTEIELHAGRVDAEYMLMPGSDVHLALNLSFGAGSLDWSRRSVNPGEVDTSGSYTMLLVDAGARFYYDATDWLQVGFGFTWQTGFHWAFDNSGPGTLSGPSGDMTLRVGFF